MSNVSNFEFGDGEFDSQNYKSCFARSVVVNSDYRLKNIIANSDLIKKVQLNQGQVKGAIPKMSDAQGQSFVRMRKVSIPFYFKKRYTSTIALLGFLSR